MNQNNPQSVVLNNLTSQLSRLNKAELEKLREALDEALAKRTVSRNAPMRSAEEYFEATRDARLEGEELMPLKQQYLANGRMFKLTAAQQLVIEGHAGKLAHNEITVYDVSWDALEQQVVSFSLQCNVSRVRRRGALVTAYHVANAQRFFQEVQRMEEEPPQAVVTKPKVKAKASVEDRAKRLEALLDGLL